MSGARSCHVPGHWFTGWLVGEVAAEDGREVRRDRLLGRLAVLRLRRSEDHAGRLRIDPKRFGSQDGQLTLSIARSDGYSVQEAAIESGEAAVGDLARAGRIKQRAKLIVGERPPIVSQVRLSIRDAQVSERVVACPPILHHPPAELLDGTEIVSGRLSPPAPPKSLLQRLGDFARESPGLAVARPCKSVTTNQGAHGRELRPERGGQFRFRELFRAGRQRRSGRALGLQVG
jgi:hypothetical protein